MFHGSLLDAQNAGVMGRTLNLHRFYGMHKQKTNITINVLLHSKGALKLMNISQLESVFEDSKKWRCDIKCRKNWDFGVFMLYLCKRKEGGT